MRNEFLPYVGPRPFEREDQALFFGRDREANELVSFVIAHDLVVIYAQSGAGKTSLINARLIPDLEEEGFEVLRVERLGRAIPEGFQLNDISNIYVFNTLTIWAKDEADPKRLLRMSLRDYLKERESPRGERGLPSLRVAIFDQFEELFSSYQERWKDRKKFFEQVAAALEENRFLRVVFVMREEYLAQLDPYASLLPEKLRARFRLECLREKPALAAITGPLRGTGRSFAEGVAKELVQNLMGDSEYVEPVQLQVVCQNLWDRTTGVTLITSDHLQSFGDVDEALMGLYEDALGAAAKETGVNEGDLREWFGKHLITPGRTRGDVFRGEEDTAGIRNAAVDVLERRRIIRLGERKGGLWYELTHDRWITPVRRSNENWRKQRDEEEHQRQLEAERQRAREQQQRDREEQERQLEAERQRAREQQQRAERERRVKMRLWGLAALLVVAAAIIANLAREYFEAKKKAEWQSKVAVEAEKKAEWQSKVSVAVKLAARARDIRPHPSDLIESSLLLAVEAVQALGTLHEHSIEAEEVIHRGLALLPREVARFQQPPEVIHRGLALLRRDVAPFPQPPAVNSVAFSPDGKYLATGCRDVVTAWPINTKGRVVTMRHSRSILNLFGQSRDVLSVAFSPDGKYLAAGSADGTAQVWETNSWKGVTRANCKGDVYSVAFSPDGKYLAAGSADNTARVLDVSTRKEVAIIRHEDEVNVVTFSPDGKHLATGSDDGTTRVWEVISGRELARMVYGAPVYSVAFSPDGKYLAAGGADNTARVWDVSTRKEVATMRHEDEVNVVAFSPDGTYLATGSHDGTARVWEVISGRELARMVYGASVHNVAFTPDAKYLATGGWDDTARVWDTSSEEEVAIMKHEGGVNVVTLSPDGKRLATGSDDGTARVWEVISGWEVLYKVQPPFVDWVALSPDGKYLAMARRDGTARVWNILKGREIAMVRHPVELLRTGAGRGLFDSVFAGRTRSAREVADEIAHCVALSPDGTYLATAIRDRTARVWETATGKELSKIEHDADVSSVAFSPDGRYLATGGQDKTARVWDVAGAKEVARMVHGDSVSVVTFSPNGQYLATGSRGGTARLWGATSGRLLARMSHDGGVRSAMFSADGKYLATASDDGTARVWRTTGGKEVARMTHGDSVCSAAFSPDAKYLATGSVDRTARVWDISTGKEVARMTLDSPVYEVAFIEGGKRLVTAGEDGTARLFWWQPEDLISEASARLTRNLTYEEWKEFFPGKQYRKTFQNLPIHPSFIEAGRDMARAGNTKGAIAHFKKALKLQPDLNLKPEVEARRLAAETLVEKGRDSAREDDVKGAIAHFREALELQPDLDLKPEVEARRLAAEAHIEEGRDSAREGDVNSAVAQFTKAKGLDPTLRLDPQKEAQRLAVESIMAQGRSLAMQGDVGRAIAQFQKAKEVNPRLDFDPKQEAEQQARRGEARKRLSEGRRLVIDGRVKEAIDVYKEIEVLDAGAITAEEWNTLGWQGSLWGHAAAVMFACEKAVKLNPTNGGIRDTRGLARALTGDYKGAIEDFKFYTTWGARRRPPEYLARRLAWIRDLEAGRNPFNQATLEALRSE